ncbi:hepatocyte cell adhesion molecule-like isoform X2 [Cervus canadensis]|nr:hepatocyte cell adhesion molecule-like isoform X2 [Cervus canadensis]
MYGIRGGSGLFHVIKEQEADPEEVSWGFGPESNYRVLLRVRRGADTPTWVSLQDKYQQRVHVPNGRSLKIESLTSEDSGQYRARASFTGGIERTEVFHLTVDEPVITPEILVKSSSITPGWCNITLECKSPGNREDLSVTWESKGLPRELEWSGTPELAPNTWELTVKRSLIQSSANFTCVVSNHVEKKTASVDFAQVCSHGTHRQMMADSLGGILWTIVVVLFFLGT